MAGESYSRSGFVAVLTLALGIGVNSGMLSFVNGLLLRPLYGATRVRRGELRPSFARLDRCDNQVRYEPRGGL